MTLRTRVSFGASSATLASTAAGRLELFQRVRQNPPRRRSPGRNGVAVGAGLASPWFEESRSWSWIVAPRLAGYPRIGGLPDASVDTPSAVRRPRRAAPCDSFSPPPRVPRRLAGDGGRSRRRRSIGTFESYCQMIAKVSSSTTRSSPRGAQFTRVDLVGPLRYELVRIRRRFWSEDGKEARKAFIDHETHQGPTRTYSWQFENFFSTPTPAPGSRTTASPRIRGAEKRSNPSAGARRGRLHATRLATKSHDPRAVCDAMSATHTPSSSSSSSDVTDEAAARGIVERIVARFRWRRRFGIFRSGAAGPPPPTATGRIARGPFRGR